jgi:NCS1 family nucleobase:cation symporter-1
MTNALTSDPRPPDAPAPRFAIEAQSVGFITDGERHGKAWKQGPFWFTSNFNFFSIALGFVGPSLGLSLLWTIVAAGVGSMFGGLFVSLHASQGPRLGLPQMIQSRAQFGYRGVLVPVLVVLFNFMVFNVLQGNVLETGLNGVFGWSEVLVVVGVSVLAALLAIFGHDWLHKMFRIVFWVSIPFYAILTIGMLSGHAGGQAPTSYGGFHISAFMAVFAATASYNLTLAPYVSDYTRYLPATTKTWRVVLAVQGGTSLSLVWLVGMGAWLATRAGATDGLVSLYTSGNHMISHLGTLLAILSAVGLIAVMGINTYSAVLSVATIIDCFKPVAPSRILRVSVTAALLVVWVIVILNLGTDQSTLITNLLNILLYLLVPWTSVNLIDYFVVRRGHYAITEILERGGGIYGEWAWRGLTAYIIGLAAEVPFMVLTFYTGPLARRIDGIDVSFVIGIIVASLVYILLARSLKLNAETTAITRSDAILHHSLTPETP